MPRTTKEWVGKNSNSMPPESVRLRILRNADHKCHLTGIIIAPGQSFDVEHVKAISEGGLNVESNLRPALRLPHEVKTAAENKRKAKADRQARAAFGEKDPNRKKIESPSFKLTPKRAVEQLPLPPRQRDIFGRQPRSILETDGASS